MILNIGVLPWPDPCVHARRHLATQTAPLDPGDIPPGVDKEIADMANDILRAGNGEFVMSLCSVIKGLHAELTVIDQCLESPPAPEKRETGTG